MLRIIQFMKPVRAMNYHLLLEGISISLHTIGSGVKRYRQRLLSCDVSEDLVLNAFTGLGP